jgi:DNA-binding response OmpR family regulator
MHALIIEQDTWITMMIEDALRDLGYTSFAFAASTDAAIAAARIRCPDLITSDVRFGDGTGIEAVRQICAEKAIRVVFVTSAPWEVRAIDRTAVVVPKPFDEKMLKQGVAKATGAQVCHAQSAADAHGPM